MTNNRQHNQVLNKATKALLFVMLFVFSFAIFLSIDTPILSDNQTAQVAEAKAVTRNATKSTTITFADIEGSDETYTFDGSTAKQMAYWSGSYNDDGLASAVSNPFSWKGDTDSVGWTGTVAYNGDLIVTVSTSLTISGFTFTGYDITWTTYTSFNAGDGAGVSNKRQYMYMGFWDKSNTNNTYEFSVPNTSDYSSTGVGDWDGWDNTYGYYYYTTDHSGKQIYETTTRTINRSANESTNQIDLKYGCRYDNGRSLHMNNLNSYVSAISIKFNGVKISPHTTNVTKTYGDTISGSDWFVMDGLTADLTYYKKSDGTQVTTSPLPAIEYKVGAVIKKSGTTVCTYNRDDGLTLTVNKKSLTGFSSTSASIYQGEAFPTSSFTLSASGFLSGHQLSYSVSSNYNASAVETGTFNVIYSNIKVMSGGTDVSSNYSYSTTQTFSGKLTVNRGDFGRQYSTKWGTSSNPYLIESADDLVRLSRIVNGFTTPINSIAGYGGATASTVQATSTTYEGAYFKLTTNISNPYVTIAPSGYTGISATAAGNGGEEIGKLFDGNTGTKYCASTGNEITIKFSLPNVAYVTGYYWNVANDTNDSNNNKKRNPSYFKLYGSNDGTNWTKLDDRSNDGWTTTNFARVDCTCNTATGYYKNFKVETKSNGIDIYQISEFGLTSTSPNVFVPIGNNTNQFKGNINGNGCTVSGLSVTGSSNYAGLFGYTNGSTISNLTVSGGVSGTYRVGAFIGHAESTTISNCNATSVTISGKQFVGGLVGYAGSSTISSATASGAVNCTNNEGESKCGGIVGNAVSTTISSCTNNATVTGTGSQVGGIVGYSDNASSLSGTITNLGKITGVGMVGGIGGQCHADQLTGTVFVNGDTGNRNSATVGNINGSGDSVGGLFGFFDSITGTNVSYTNFGTVNSSSTAVGGIVGRVQESITGAVNHGNITVMGGNTRSDEVIQSGTAVGGITGYTNNNITNCTNNGSITATNGTVVGGIVGTFSSTLITFSNNRNYGTISAKDNVGGIVGFGGALTVSNCYNSGDISATSNNVGGIVGNSSGTVQYCYNEGSVSGNTNTGGIVGNSSGTVQYCYNNCAANTITGTGDSVGGVVGNSSGTVASSCWTIYSNDSVRTSNNHNSGIVSGNKKDKYVVYDSSLTNVIGANYISADEITYVNTWTQITGKNINSIVLFSSAKNIESESGSYLSISSSASSGSYVSPVYRADQNGQAYFQNLIFDGSVSSSSVYVSKKTISLNTISLTYNGGSQIGYLNAKNWWNGNPTNLRVVFTKVSGDDINVGSFSASAEVKSPSDTLDIILGKKASTSYSISRADAQVVYGGITYGVVLPNLDPRYKKDDYTNISYYKDNTAQTSVLFQYPVEYDSNGNFVKDATKWAKLNDGTYFELVVWNGIGTTPESFNSLIKDGTGKNNFTVEYSRSIPEIDDMKLSSDGGFGVYECMSATFSGTNINTFTIYFTLVMSDFAKFDNTTANTAGFSEFVPTAKWGSAQNPYVISSWVHMVRLMEIVNHSSNPINSVAGMGICTSLQQASQPASGSISYAGGYFFLAADMDLSDYSDFINWQPIGGWQQIDENVYLYPFSGSFDGNDKTLTLELNCSEDYVGLFGYVSAPSTPLTIHDLTIYGTVEGKNNVGALAGYAMGNVRIYDIENYASVTGKSKVGGIVGVVGAGVNLGTGNGTQSALKNFGNVTGNERTSSFDDRIGFVGGIAGIVYAGAGIQSVDDENTYILGANAGFENEGIISGASNYVGGIFGAMVENTLEIKIFTTFKPLYARNTNNIEGVYYVGGLFGQVRFVTTPDINSGNVVEIENKKNNDSCWSYSGYIDDTIITISGSYYVGGIAGEFGSGSHSIKGVFVTARIVGGDTFNGNNDVCIGGIAGKALGGKFENCFVTNPDGYAGDDPIVDFSQVSNVSRVGGLIGYLSSTASVVNGIVQNCDLESINNRSRYRGGLVGETQGTGSNISGYAIYKKLGVTYTDNLTNTYGSYIIVYSTMARLMSVRELFVYMDLREVVEDDKFSATYDASNNSKAQKNHVSVGVALPESEMYVAFYDVKGTRSISPIPFTASNNADNSAIFIKFENTEGSMIIGLELIEFDWDGVQNDDSNKSLMEVSENWQSAFHNKSVSKMYGSNISPSPYVNNAGNTYSFNIQATYNIGGTNYYTSRNISYSYTQPADEIIIATVKDWETFRDNILKSNTYKKVKLISDLTLTSDAGLKGSPTTGGIKDGTTDTKVGFSGTSNTNRAVFEGNGHTLTISVESSLIQGFSLFRNAKWATFRNLTIAGTLTSTSGNQNMAAFVGEAQGSLTFENCTNDVDIESSNDNVGGFIGKTSVSGTYRFENCVNTGTVKVTGGNRERETSSIWETAYWIGTGGTGGFIGYLANTSDSAIFDGCRNAGDVTAVYNVAGFVGFLNGRCDVYSSGNSGNIKSTTTNKVGSGSTSGYIDSNAAGICGYVTISGHADLYASFNSGDIWAGGSKAGGLIASDTKNTGSTTSYTYIMYCYNTGRVQTGGDTPLEATGENPGGGCVGGIIGYSVKTLMKYCYNLGTIVSNGAINVLAYTRYAFARVGGLVGVAEGRDDAITIVEQCYNIGQVQALCGADGRTVRGYGPIVGECQGSETADHVSIDSTVSLKDACWVRTGKVQGWQNVSSVVGIYERGCGFTGTDEIDSIKELTSYNTSDGGVGHDISAIKDNKYSYSSETSDLFYKIRNKLSSLTTSTEAWLLIPGCLPQLAVFAVDTRDGLAMTAPNAGTEEMPYIIKDGVDLMGLSALTNSGYSFSNEYIEFANAKNNLNGDICTYINMPQYETITDKDDWYKFADGNNSNAYTIGKSYHLFERGAGDSSVYNSWLSKNYGYQITSHGYTSGYNLYRNNFIPIGNISARSFNGHLSGILIDAAGVNIGKAEVRNLEIEDALSSSKSAFGLIGYLGGNGSVENLIVTGQIKAEAKSNATAYIGIIGQQSGNSTVDGVEAGTTNNYFVIEASDNSSSKTYVGGIVGGVILDSDNESVTIKNCKVVNAYKSNDFGLKGANGATGGIVGVTSGRNKSTISISNCSVLKAVISSADGQYLGGIVGRRVAMNTNEYGNLSIDDCYVGALNNTSTISAKENANVTIIGKNIIGGIISNAETKDKGSLTITNCGVYGDVCITRVNGSSNNSTYGTAIGGIAGYSLGVSSSPVVIRGGIVFYGLIDVDVQPAVGTNIENIGGVVGYMGAFTVISSGAYTVPTIVNVAGTIKCGDKFVYYSIGGVAGISNGGALDGEYTLNTQINAPNGTNIGGFIGNNEGETSIARTAKVTSNGAIIGKENVGGFIGSNNATINIGASSINGASYGNDNDKLEIDLSSSVDGHLNVGGFVGLNANKSTVNGQYVEAKNYGEIGAGEGSVDGDTDTYAFGGIIGANVGTFKMIAGAIFSNAKAKQSDSDDIYIYGQVGYENGTNSTENAENANQNYVGGIIGVSKGTLDINPNAELSNYGKVYGNYYVGGAIGGLASGTINGKMENNGNVYGINIVGGVFGIVMQDATIAEGNYINHAEGNIGSNDVKGGGIQFAGGVIGAMYGTISGSTIGASDYASGMANFENYGTISNAISYSGGAIGLVDGSINNARFVNSASLKFAGGDSVGGVIGYITSVADVTTAASTMYYPGDKHYGTTFVQDKVTTSVTNTYFGYQSSNDEGLDLEVTGTSQNGGVGGVIGTIDASEITSSDEWNGNSFFVNGNVKAKQADYVGGVIGWIVRSSSTTAPYITINNMLAYGNSVSGRNYVGGIVGFNGSANTKTGNGASLVNCYKIRGYVTGSSNRGGIVGGYYIPKDDDETSSPTTYSCYWVDELPNESIYHINPSDIGGSLTATWTVDGQSDYINVDGCEPPEDSRWTTWADYISVRKLIYNEINGQWGTYSSNGIPYSTGVANGYTGYFFLYAKNDSCPVENGIDAVHDDANDIEYWKKIADTADAKTESLTSPIVYDNGNVVKGNIYATAKGATVAPNNYYLNIIARNGQNDTFGDLNLNSQNDKLYVSISGEAVGNVVIYYKPVSMTKNYIYDGEYHEVQFSDITKADKPQTSTGNTSDGEIYYALNSNYADTSDDDPDLDIRTINDQTCYFNKGIDKGTYDVDADVWMITDNGNTFVLGNILSRDNMGGFDGDCQWTIGTRKFTIKLNVGTAQDVVYDGAWHSVTVSIDNASGLPESVGQDRFEVTFDDTTFGGCNVDNYSFTPQSIDVSKYIKAYRNGDHTKDVTSNYEFTIDESSASGVSFRITAAPITVTLGGTTEFVYDGTSHGPTVSVSVGYGNGTQTVTSSNADLMTISGSTLTVKFTNAANKQETLTFNVSALSNINAGNYSAKVNSLSNVTGQNADGNTKNGNYSFEKAVSESYKIDQSELKWDYSDSSFTKEYDGNTNLPSAVSKTNVSFTSTNDGAVPNSTEKNSLITSISGQYTDKNAGNRNVTITIGFNSAGNYKLSNSSSLSITKNGTITKRGITIQLNVNNRIYKTYDRNNSLTTWQNGTSSSPRLGRGISKVSNIIAGDNVSILFSIAEETAERATLNSSINGIKVERVGDKDVYSAPDSKSKKDYLKQAIVELQNGSNYYIKDISTLSGNVYSDSDGNKGYSKVYILDSETKLTSLAQNQVKSNLDIAINPYNVQASYQNTMQSYANEDNTYNTDWKAVTASIPNSTATSGVSIHVVNKWMTENGNPRQIKKYTQFSGNPNATDDGPYMLGAYLTSTDGYSHLNLKLKNQPNVIIGYFVEQTDGGYKVGSLSGLLLATEYYKGAQNPDGDTTETVSEIIVVPDNHFKNYPDGSPTNCPTYNNGAEGTVSVSSWADYETKYREYLRNKYNAEYGNGVGDAAAESLQYSTYYDESSETEKWCYILEYQREITIQRYIDFVQVDNIDGTLTEKDLEILNEQFGADWGVGKKHLGNVVVSPTVGSVVTFIGAIFDGTFNGSYSGNGYTIDHINIIANVNEAGEYNAGMFAHVQPGGTLEGKGEVSDIHLRNVNLQVFDTNPANTNGIINVGGIVGKNGSNTTISNSSFHGTIIVNTKDAVVNVGGIVGLDSSIVVNGNSIDGAIVIANIFATSTNGTVNAGGIVGNTNAHTYNDIVSMSEIYATASTSKVGGLIGNGGSNTTINGTKTYLANGVYTISGTTYTTVNKLIGNGSDASGVNYSALYNGSTSLYANSSSNRNTYDVIADCEAMVDMGVHESMRLRDIIDVYVLLYEKIVGTDSYSKGSSWVAQGANGTTSSKLNIAYRQHTSLLRMFNYMDFIINRDITMAAEYGTLADITKTDNGENIVVSYVATPAKEAFFGNISGTGTINFRYKNTASSVLMFAVQDELLTRKLVYDNTVVYQTA